MPPSSLDCVERFLYRPEEEEEEEQESKTNLDLPVLGSSALEQFLQQAVVQQQRLVDMERMSPDSTMEPLASETASISLTMVSQQYHSGGIAAPDSTTSDLTYDSDAFNSEDSCSSFAEVQATASASNAHLLLLPEEDEEDDSSASSASPASPSFDLVFQNNMDNNNSRKHKKVKVGKAKKTKRAGDVLLQCHQCQYTTRFKEHLASHMHTHATARNYMCSDCGQTFKWSHSLRRHQRTHSPTADFRYTCHFCFKSFSRKDHLSIHEGLHTSSGASFPCNQCGATFKNKKTLTGHMKTHNAEKAFKCSQCESEFTRRASLNRHIRAAHTGHVITCPMCPAVFSYRSTLEDHKKAAHNHGKREFACDLCGVQFAVKAYLYKHMVTCRNRAVGKTFACGVCSKKFPTKRHLHEHGKRKHPAAPLGSVASPQTPSTNMAPSPAPSTAASISSSFSSSSTCCSSPQSLESPPDYNKSYQRQQQYQTNGMGYGQDMSYYYPNYNCQQQQQQDQQKLDSNGHHPAVMGTDLPLPQLSCPAVEEDHNVGSLLRLVYSCPDQLDNDQTGDYQQQQQQQQQSAAEPVKSEVTVCSNEPLMDYPMLDGISLDYL